MTRKDEAVGRVIRLLEQCDVSTAVHIADELEDSLELGSYGVLIPRNSEVEPISVRQSREAYERIGLGL